MTSSCSDYFVFAKCTGINSIQNNKCSALIDKFADIMCYLSALLHRSSMVYVEKKCKFTPCFATMALRVPECVTLS